MRNYYYYIPLICFLLLVLFFGRQLFLNEDPSNLPSVLVDEEFPVLEFVQLEKYNLLLTSDILSYDRPSLVNVWASWCTPCKVEHANLMVLKMDYEIRIYGINYKDDIQEANKMLVKKGNPFYSIGVDSTGRESINLGVYGIPETFILDSEGQIRYRHVGPILEFDLRETILPILTKLEKER